MKYRDADEKIRFLTCRVDADLWQRIEDAVVERTGSHHSRKRSKVIRDVLRLGLDDLEAEVTRG